MFSRFTRLPLRRCLHTFSPRSSPSYSRLTFAVGASAATATYFAWRMTSDTQRISLDSATKLSPLAVKQSSTSLSPLPEPVPSTHFDSEPLVTAAPSPDIKFPSQPEAEGESAPAEGSAPASEGDSPEGDAGSGGAYNPVTGEINWDCPCLGGMAHGPCGPEFREAFSCFIFSEEEPKGINCVEKFQGMQNCFREHPEIYGDEIMDDDEDDVPIPAANEGESPSIPNSELDEQSVDASTSAPTPLATTTKTQKRPEVPPERSSPAIP